MAFTLGDYCIPASTIFTETLIEVYGEVPLFGVVTDAAAVDVLWNNGQALTATTAASLRQVNPGGANTLVGSNVQVTGRSPLWRGLVIAGMQVELSSVGASGAITACVLIRTAGGQYFFARASEVELVP